MQTTETRISIGHSECVDPVQAALRQDLVLGENRRIFEGQLKDFAYR